MFGIGIFSREVKRLKSDLQDRDQRINQLQAQLDQLRDQTPDSGFELHWGRLKAFSIERCVQDGRPATMLGFWRGANDQDTGEWVLYCNQATHERLVREFCEHRGS